MDIKWKWKHINGWERSRQRAAIAFLTLVERMFSTVGILHKDNGKRNGAESEKKEQYPVRLLLNVCVTLQQIIVTFYFWFLKIVVYFMLLSCIKFPFEIKDPRSLFK